MLFIMIIDLPSLSSLVIGTIDTPSSCFYSGSLFMYNIGSLTSFSVGVESFENASDVVITSHFFIE